MKISTTARVTMALTLFALCSGVVLAPPTAEAASEITGITVSPSPATRGSPVTITVTGKGDPCPSIDLDFGDGMPHATFSGPFPRPTTHIYTSTGTMTLRARGVKGCTGDVTKTLTVTATSPDPLERPRAPILLPPPPIKPVQPPKPLIETDLQRRLAALPVIEEFQAIASTCQLPDPNRPILSFRVSNNVARVQISEVGSDGGTSLFYDRSAEPGRPWPSLAESGIRDPFARPFDAFTLDAYVLVVTGADGQVTSGRLNFHYQIPPRIFELLSPAVRKTELNPGRWWRYTFNCCRDAHVTNFRVVVRYTDSSGRVIEAGPSPSFNPAEAGVRPFYWDTEVNFNYDSPATFVFRAEAERNACGGGEIIERTAVLPAEAPAGIATADLPDLVPAIGNFVGTTFRVTIENRGRTAVTTPFVMRLRSNLWLPREFEVRDRIDPGRSWVSEPIEMGFDGYTYPDWMAADVDVFNQVRESEEGNNSAAWPPRRSP